LGHNLEQLGTASLDTMGGLFLNCNPQDLPEGASPRCWDVDFIVGSVFTRAGLVSVYAYATLLSITEVVIGSGGLATFTYSGSTPTINESFVLGNFTGNAFFLNGQTIYVISFNQMLGTFTAEVTGPSGTYSGQSGEAISTVGQFVGPNVPTAAFDIDTENNPWSNPTGILGSTSYASTSVGTTSNTQVPSIVTNSVSEPWDNPNNITNPTFPGALSSTSTVSSLIVSGMNFSSIPAGATVQGLSVAISTDYTVTGPETTQSLSMQLTTAGTPVGTSVTKTLTTTGIVNYVYGSSSYQWGLSLSSSFLNNNLGIQVEENGGNLTNRVHVWGLTATVYYTAPESDVLQAQTFTFSIPLTSGITGIASTFQAYSSASTSLSLQLTKNGVAVGSPIVQDLTTEPTVYTIGGGGDLWGTTWSASDINSTGFGVQITASGQGTSYINDLDVLVYVTPALANFNYVSSYIQNSGQTYTLALDANGNMWLENVTSLSGFLSLQDIYITPGTFAQSSPFNNREYVCFSDLSIGTDRPRSFDGNNWYPVSQCGPGAPPTFTTSSKSGGTVLDITAYSNPSSGVITFTFTELTPPFTPVVGSLYTIEGTGNAGLDGFTFSVLGTPAPSDTTFSVDSNATGSGSVTATASPTNAFDIVSITQNQLGATEPVPFNGQLIIWSAPGSFATPGLTITCFYGTTNQPENPGLLAALNLGLYPVYVYISGAPFGNGTQLVTGHGTGAGPNQHGPIPYFTFIAGSSAHIVENNNGNFQMTVATITTAIPIPNLVTGAQVQIAGATPAAWNNTWTIINTLLNGSYDINSSQMLAGGIAQFQYSNASATGAPVVTNGQLIELSGLTANPAFNTTGVVSDATASTFQIAGFPAFTAAQIAEGVVPETGQAVTFGTEFVIDPGPLTFGTANDPIYGNDSGTGTLTVIGGSIIPIGPGIRQGVVYFITETEYETTPSAPFQFSTPEGTDEIICSNIPIGPPDTIARALAFTEAGQNGVAGENFYVIEEPVTTTVDGVVATVPSTIINDNVTTQISLAFTDAVLLNSREIDVQGDDLFNLIELGSSGWCIPYASRMFYGLQLNKINNWWTGGGLTFDAGYLPSTTGILQPLGWSTVNTVDQQLLISPITGQALYIKNTYGATTAQVGMIYQTAYQDPNLVAIIQPNTYYSVRVACEAPSGITTGTLVIDLTDYTPAIGFGKTYGSFSVPLSSMSTVMQVFSGTLLTTQFTTSVSANLQIRVYLANAGANADCLIDRIEVFPTLTPYLKAQVYGSYVGEPETIDASSTGGIIDTTTENSQACMGAFVMHDLLYLLKTQSWYSTQADPNSEPGGWGLKEVSDRVGTIGINSYDTGEEWCITACRAGIYGFDGGEPTKISQELWNLWEQINWKAGDSIVVRNDIVSKRLYVAIPLPTGINPATGLAANKYTIQWLPNAPYNPTPTTPNVMLMLNYQGLANIKEMMVSPEVHTTMFGALAAPDMKRKWAIWNIATPYMQFIMQPDGETEQLYICNGIGTSKIYELDQDQYSDDGVAINSLYTTYGFVNAAKAATLPIFGFHAKRYTVFQTEITGGQLTSSQVTNAKIRMLPNTISPKYPYTVPVGIPLVDPLNDDYFRAINVKGNRMFVEVSTNAVGSWFNLSKILLTGKADPWSTLNPTGGGNAGIV
jgi:hypothetical protein